MIPSLDVGVVLTGVAYAVVVSAWTGSMIVLTQQLYHQTKTMDQMMVSMTFPFMVMQALVAYHSAPNTIKYQSLDQSEKIYDCDDFSNNGKKNEKNTIVINSSDDRRETDTDSNDEKEINGGGGGGGGEDHRRRRDRDLHDAL
jgi:hypothetical protein